MQVELETKYLIKEKDRHGNVRFYYRHKPGPRIRIRAAYGTMEFAEAYRLAERGVSLDAKGKQSRAAAPQLADPGSLRDLIVRYYGSAEFKMLDERTRKVRKLILDKLCNAGGTSVKKPYGKRPAGQMEPRHVKAIRDEHADRPEAANSMVKALRRVFAVAVDDEVPGIKSNPAREVPYLRSRSQGHHSWTIEEVGKFEERHPVGTKARLALAILLYLGQRRSDVVKFGPGLVSEGWLHFTQHKGRNIKPVTLSLPIIDALQDILDASELGEETWLVGEYGKPFTAESFGNWFRERCVEAKVPGRAHGLRKAAASRLAELGCSDREIMAITGHSTSKEVDRYTRAARQKVMAASAMQKLSSGAADKAPHLRLVSGRTR